MLSCAAAVECTGNEKPKPGEIIFDRQNAPIFLRDLASLEAGFSPLELRIFTNKST